MRRPIRLGTSITTLALTLGLGGGDAQAADAASGAPAPPALPALPTPYAPHAPHAPHAPEICGADNRREDSPAWGKVITIGYYPKQSIAPRDKPAELRQQTELTMLEQGFIPVGWIEVTRYTHLYESKPSEPAGQPIEGPKSALGVAQEEAAKLGADTFVPFGAEQSVSKASVSPGLNGWGQVVGTLSGTEVKGAAWQKAPAASRAQLLVYAAQHGLGSVVQRLLKERVPIDSREPRFCWTPLLAAAQYGHSDVVRLLIGSGAKLEQVDLYGRTALAYAAFPVNDKIGKRRCESARLLRQAGAKEPDGPPGPSTFDFPAPPRCPK